MVDLIQIFLFIAFFGLMSMIVVASINKVDQDICKENGYAHDFYNNRVVCFDKNLNMIRPDNLKK